MTQKPETEATTGGHIHEASQNVDGFNTPVKRAPTQAEQHKENINPVYSFSASVSTRITSLFEDTCSQSNDFEAFGTATYLLDELSQTASCLGDDNDLLDDFKRKKMSVFLRMNPFMINF